MKEEDVEAHTLSFDAQYTDGLCAAGVEIQAITSQREEILSGSKVIEGTKVTLTMTKIPSNMTMEKWVVNEVEQSANNSIAITMDEDLTVYTVMKPTVAGKNSEITYDITGLDSEDESMITVSATTGISSLESGAAIPTGQPVVLWADRSNLDASEYEVLGWSIDNGTTYNGNDTLEISALNTDVEAVYGVRKIEYVILTYQASAGGEISGTAVQTIKSGTTGNTVTAVADSGYKFVQWSDGVTSATRTDKDAIKNLTVTAQFEKLPSQEQQAAEQQTTEQQAAEQQTTVTVSSGECKSDYATLQAKASKTTKTSIKISWKKVSGAEKYSVYGNKYGTKNEYQELATVTKNTFTQKKLKKGTYYQYYVVAYDKNNKAIAKSELIYTVTDGGKYGNVKSVTTAAKNNKVNLKINKTFKLKAKAVAKNRKLKMKKYRSMRYESTNSKIATVSNNGVIKGKAKGTCYVFAYAQNGISRKIKVTVK